MLIWLPRSIRYGLKPTRRQSLKGTALINARNFDFDDLYRIGKEKVGKLASKEGMKNILSSGGKQIKKGLGLAENIVRRYIQHPKSEQEE